LEVVSGAEELLERSLVTIRGESLLLDLVVSSRAGVHDAAVARDSVLVDHRLKLLNELVDLTLLMAALALCKGVVVGDFELCSLVENGKGLADMTNTVAPPVCEDIGDFAGRLQVGLATQGFLSGQQTGHVSALKHLIAGHQLGFIPRRHGSVRANPHLLSLDLASLLGEDVS
jgi:hypothetical protein